LIVVPKMSTIVPKMSTMRKNNLSEALFSKSRKAILALLFSNTDEAFYIRQLSRAAGVFLGPLQRELKRLTDAGIIQRTMHGKQVYYQANKKCPIFEELKSFIVKTAGIADVLRGAISSLADKIDCAFVYGSFAEGEQRAQSDVDVMVIGDVSFKDVSAALSGAQETLSREVNPTVYPLAEFKKKIASGHHFLNTVLKEKKIFLIGDEDELRRLAQKQVAKKAPYKPKRNR